MSTKQIEKTTKAILVDTRCRYVSASGRRCRALAARDTSRASGLSAFCLSHSQLEQQYVNTKPVAEELLAGMDNFRTAVGVNDLLGRLFVLQAQNRIPIRNAMALAYTARVILSSLDTVCDEVLRVKGRSGHNQLIHAALNQTCARQVAEEVVSKDEEQEANEQDRPENSLDAAIRILKGS